MCTDGLESSSEPNDISVYEAYLSSLHFFGVDVDRGPLKAELITSCSVLLLSFSAFLSAGSGELDKSDSVQSSSKDEAAMAMMQHQHFKTEL